MSVTPVPSENEDDFDIYGDLPVATTSPQGVQERSNEGLGILREQISHLMIDLEAQRIKNEKLMSLNTNLSCNISILYNTAFSEIERKDKTISELRKKIDDICFRRKGRQLACPVAPVSNKAFEVDLNHLRENLKQQLSGDVEVIVCEPEVFESQKQSPDVRPVEWCTDSMNENRTIHSVKDHHTVKDFPKVKKVSQEKHVTVKSQIVTVVELVKSPNASVNDGPKKLKKSVWDRLGFMKKPSQSNSVLHSEVTEPNEGIDTTSGRASSMHVSVHAQEELGCESNENLEERVGKSLEKDPHLKVEYNTESTNMPIKTCHGISENNVSITCEPKVPTSTELSSETFPSQTVQAPSDDRNSSTDLLASAHIISGSPGNKENNPSVNLVITSSATNINQSHECLEDSQLQESKEDQSPPRPPDPPSSGPQQQARDSECISSESSILPFKIPLQRSPATKVESSSTECRPAISVNPPLPKEDPAPLPPLPLTSPPPTPMKMQPKPLVSKSETAETLRKEMTDLSKSIEEKNDKGSSSLTTAGDKKEGFPTSSPLITSNSKNSFQSLNENLMMQCPFKPRRRAKSVVVLEDVPIADLDESASLKTNQSSHVSLNRCKSPESKFKRTPLKKYNVQENRLASDYRSYQMQRSVYSSRHLSSFKSFSHVPERRSPSELLNGRSGRIVRLAQDKIRSRDKRSRSLSPIGRNLRQVRYQTRNVSNNTSRDIRRRNFADERQKRGEKKEECRKPKTLNLRKKLEGRVETEKPKSKSKSNSRMVDLFGESSPEPEEKSSKISTKNPKILDKEQKTVNCSSLGNLNNKTFELIKDGIAQDLEEEHIVVKRKPRSSIHLANSENCIPTSAKTQDCPASLVNGNKTSISLPGKSHCNKPQADRSQNINSTGTQLVHTRDRNLKRSIQAVDSSDDSDRSFLNTCVLNSKLFNFNPEVSNGRPFKKRK